MSTSTWMKTTMQRSRQYKRHRRMNTHFYDGKLKEAKAQLTPYLDDVGKIAFQDKLELFAKFTSLLVLRPTTTQQSQHNLSVIIADYQKCKDCGKSQQPGDPNYDASNNLASEDLLYFLADLVCQVKTPHQDDFLDLANQQFTEMSSGMCPQGRAYRILQVIWPTLDFVMKSQITASSC